MSDLVERGIEAVQAGDKLTARGLLVRAVLANPQDVDAWLWLSGAVDTSEERLACLTKVLEINPDHSAARHGADALRLQGVALPESAVGADVPGPPAEAEGVLGRFAGLNHTRAFGQLEPRRRHALRGFSRLVAQQLEQGRRREQVADELVVRGFPRMAVEQLVDEVASPMNRQNLLRHRRQLLRGGLIALSCLVATLVVTLVGADLGPFVYVLYGGIALGVGDFVGGIVGWYGRRV